MAFPSLKYEVIILFLSFNIFGQLGFPQTLDYLLDPTFAPTNVIGGNGALVSSILIHEDGRYSVSGAFQTDVEIMTRFLNNGQLDPSFTTTVNASVLNYIQFLNEHYLVNGGNIGIVGFDGSLPFGYQFLDYSTPTYEPDTWPQSTVGWTQILEDNKIMVAGRFSPDTTDLEDRRHLVRVMPDGSPDTSFEPLKCQEPYDAWIIDLYPTPGGKWMIAGEFMDVNGYESPGIARLNENFSIDTTFKSPFPDHNLSVRIVQGSHPQDLSGAIDEQGRVYATHLDSLFEYNYSTNIRLLPNGDIDTTFNPPAMERYFLGSSVPGLITSMAFEQDGTLVVGGSFRKMNGHTRNCIAKLNEDGSLVENVFNRLGADTAHWGFVQNDPGVTRITRLDNGGLMVGGRFSRYDGHDQWGLVRLLPSPVGIDENSPSTLEIFPNPASHEVHINHSGSSLGNIQLYNSAGLHIKTYSTNRLPATLDISDLSPGMYLLRGENDKGQQITSKFIKTTEP